jgi:NAD(P)-dependent dehydrogenase (short-subunit alcohol dehydrogenase family)
VQAGRVNINLGERPSGEAAAEEALKRFGCIDILVNSSSVYRKSPFPTPDTSVWETSLGIILNGPFYLCNALAPAMLEKGEGVIINMVDLSIHEAWPRYTGHCVAKVGLWALTRQLALELAPTVRANAIAPGPMIPAVDYDDAKIARTANKTLMGRWGDPQDTVRTVIYICECDYLTGEVITVDGGQRYGHRKIEEG